MYNEMKWLNEPPNWNVAQNSLHVTTGNKTDFWQKTFYDFMRDDGHFFYQEVTGDFTAEVSLVGNYEILYDQSGLMLRIDENNWIKTGIEFTDGFIHLSTVITRDFSDWSVLRIPDYRGELNLRMTRHDSALRIQYLDENQKWQLVRLGYLKMPLKCQVGVMCCSPQREGFKTEFKNFVIKEPISKNLHD